MIAFKKGPKVKVISQIIEWQGNTVLDIRTHVIASKGPQKGEWIPTGKGVQIPADKAVKFLNLATVDAIDSLEQGTKVKVKKGSAK